MSSIYGDTSVPPVAILSHHVGLKGKAVTDPSDVPQVDRFRSDLLDGKITKLRDRARCDVHANLLDGEAPSW